MKKGIETARDATLEILKQFVMPVTTQKELLDVCTVSANYNMRIAKITSEAINNIDAKYVK